MKNALAITGVLFASLAANAANFSVNSTLVAVGGDGDHGSLNGSFNTSLSTLTFGVTDYSPTGPVTKFTLTDPVGNILKNVTSIIAGANHSYSGIFSSVSAPGFNSGNADKYLVKAFSGATLVAQGGLSVVTPIASTPEPETYAMVAGAALVGFAAFRRTRR
jgi:hypothetical protein